MAIRLNFEYGKLESPHEDKNTLTYYCSMDTFYKIVESKCIFMNDISAMNDPAEQIVNKFDMSKILYQLYQAEPFEWNYVYDTFEQYLSDLSQMFNMSRNNFYNIFYFGLCFSEKQNNLNMWRMYGDDGKGIAITFDKSELENVVNSNNNLKLCKVNYEKDIKSILYSIAKIIFNKIKDLSLSQDFDGLRKYKDEFFQEINNLSFMYKTQDYKDEAEIRLVDIQGCDQIICNDDVKDIHEINTKKFNTRLKNGKIILYRNFDISNLKVKNICFGPTNNYDLTATKIFLAKNKFDVEEIYKSEIPYRN